MQWNNLEGCVSDTVGDLVGKVESRARKRWITQEMISKMGERRKWKNVVTDDPGSKPDRKYARRRDRQNYVRRIK